MITPHRPAVVNEGLAVYAMGSGSVVLLMPGPHRFQRPGLRSADALISGLVGLGRTVVTFDPPGSGQSARPARLGMVEMHECAVESLTAMGHPTPVDVVGHSMGGLAALAFALDLPGAVGRLVLVGTGSGGPAYMHAPGALWNRSHRQFPQLAALGTLHLLIRRRGSEIALNNLIERASFHNPDLARPTGARIRDWYRPAQGHAEWHRIARHLDYAPRLGEITAPTLIACGLHDPQFPPACSRQLAAGIPGAQLAWFPSSGHYPFIEQPDMFWAMVGAFLDDRPAQG